MTEMMDGNSRRSETSFLLDDQDIDQSQIEDPNSPIGSFSESHSSSYSLDDSFELQQMDELPLFPLQSFARSRSPFDMHEPISLLNLSISPIASPIHLNHDREIINNTGDDSIGSPNPLELSCDRISLAEIKAQIQSPQCSSPSAKRLNLETIFEGVFLETPPKKKRYSDSWGIRRFQQHRITVERINTYVLEQQREEDSTTTNDSDLLCDMFDNQIDI